MSNTALYKTLAEKIYETFSDIPYPGDDKLVLEVKGDSDDALHIAQALKGKHWKNLSLDILLDNHDKLWFLTPEAFRFYLPAYLIANLLHHEEVGADLYSPTFDHLIPPSTEFILDPFIRSFYLDESTLKNAFEGMVELFHSHASIFNEKERAIIRDFIALHFDMYPVNRLFDMIKEEVERGLLFWS